VGAAHQPGDVDELDLLGDALRDLLDPRGGARATFI